MELLNITVSAIGLISSIIIPVRIANRQDKIALFEKRFEAYSSLLKLKKFAEIIQGEEYSFAIDDYQELARRSVLVLMHFGTSFSYHPQELHKPETVQATMAAIDALEISVHGLPFLYSSQLGEVEKIQAEISKVFEPLKIFMVDLVLQEGSIDDTNRVKFVCCTKNFVDNYAEFFERGLCIRTKKK